MKPLIVYDSMTGNVKRFVSKIGYRSIQVQENLKVEEPYILVTHTIGFGEVPITTREFLNRNSLFLLAVAGSGNRNWGITFGQAIKTISKNYRVPILHIFELAGTEEDVSIFKEEVEKLVNK